MREYPAKYRTMTLEEFCTAMRPFCANCLRHSLTAKRERAAAVENVMAEIQGVLGSFANIVMSPPDEGEYRRFLEDCFREELHAGFANAR